MRRNFPFISISTSLCACSYVSVSRWEFNLESGGVGDRFLQNFPRFLFAPETV